MNAISIPAHFDGERILLDKPVELELNTKLISMAATLVRRFSLEGGSPWYKPPSLDVASSGGGSIRLRSVSGGGLSPRQPTHRL